MKDELTTDAVDEVTIDDVEEVEVKETEAELTDEVETETGIDDEQAEPETEAEPEAEEEGGLVVSLGGEEDEEEVSQPFREMRQELREAKRRLKELEASTVTAEPDLGEKPQLADFDYDTDKFETAYADWLGRKTKAEAAQKEREESAKQAVAEFEEKKTLFKVASKKLGVKDFDAASEVVQSTLPQIVQDIIIDNAKDPALMFYALGKNPKAMEKISKATSMREVVAAAYELARQEAKMTVTGAKNKPKPETRVDGVKPVSTGDRLLEKLRAEAERTGNYTKVVAHRKAMRAKQGK